MTPTAKLTLTFSFLSVFVLSAPHAAAAQTSESSCTLGNRPAATLLFPYFEVDLADRASRTTLVSISNTSEEPAIVQAVVWSNCGLPVLDFTVYLPSFGVRSLNMADVIVSGKLPDTWPGEDLVPSPNCTEELLTPTLDEEELAAFQARLSGKPDPGDGLCYALPSESSRFVGFVTVDVLTDCSETIRKPVDTGYFSEDGTGLASNANVLSGDFFLVDGAGDTAQGFEAVAIVADASRLARPLARTFYNLDDDRLPLGSRYRTRILQGGGFSGGTELVVWLNELNGTYFYPEPGGGVPCEVGCGQGTSSAVRRGFEARVRDENSRSLESETIFMEGVVARLKVGEDLPFETRFGSIDLGLYTYCSICSPPAGQIQGWVLPIYSGAGRFSAGLAAVRLDDFCN